MSTTLYCSNCNIIVMESDLTTDGRLIDCSIDSVDFAQWFELEELEEFEVEE